MRCINTLIKTQKTYGCMWVAWAALFLSGIAGCEKRIYHQAPEDTIQVCFSPGGNCTKFIEETIAKAKKTILVQAYFFTSLPIANALIKAHQRGIIVHVLVDRSQIKYPYTKVHDMAKQGIPVSIDKTPGIAHNKIMIIDDDSVLTGSFNWTQAAEHCNAENLLLIKDTKTNQAYKKAWYERARHAQRLTVP